MDWSKWILVVDNVNQILLSLLTFIFLQILRRVFIYIASLWCVLLRKSPIVQFIWTSTSGVIDEAKFELECLLITFIYFNSRSLAKTRTLNASVSKLIRKKEHTLYYSVTILFCFVFFFFIKILTYHPE